MYFVREFREGVKKPTFYGHVNFRFFKEVIILTNIYIYYLYLFKNVQKDFLFF